MRNTNRLVLFVEILDAPASPWAERLKRILANDLGARRAEVDPDLYTATVDLGEETEGWVQRMEAALDKEGFKVRMTRAPDPAADYARYLNAPADSSEARWVD